MLFKMVEPTESRKSFASLPCIRGVTEPLTRVLKRHDVTVVNKPFTTLQQQFPAPKFPPPMESQTNVVYKIPCTNCLWCYIGETGRASNTRKKEHLRNTKTAAKVLKARLHRRFLSQQLDAIFVAPKLHHVSNMFETSAISRRQIALKIAPGLHVRFWSCSSSATKIATSCRDKNRPCKRAFKLLITPGPTTTPLILKTRQLLTKALLEPEKH